MDLAGARLLVVEDDDTIGVVLSLVFHGEGIVVLGPITTCAEALTVASTAAIDAAILDVNLPDGTTYEVAGALQMRRIPYAFLSASSRSALPDHLKPAAFLAKPASVRHLVQTLTSMVADHES